MCCYVILPVEYTADESDLRDAWIEILRMTSNGHETITPTKMEYCMSMITREGQGDFDMKQSVRHGVADLGGKGVPPPFTILSSITCPSSRLINRKEEHVGVWILQRS